MNDDLGSYVRVKRAEAEWMATQGKELKLYKDKFKEQQHMIKRLNRRIVLMKKVVEDLIILMPPHEVGDG